MSEYGTEPSGDHPPPYCVPYPTSTSPYPVNDGHSYTPQQLTGSFESPSHQLPYPTANSPYPAEDAPNHMRQPTVGTQGMAFQPEVQPTYPAPNPPFPTSGNSYYQARPIGFTPEPSAEMQPPPYAQSVYSPPQGKPQYTTPQVGSGYQQTPTVLVRQHTVIRLQEAPVVRNVIIGGNCPKCLIGYVSEQFSICGIVWAIICFPLGLICCCLMTRKVCSHCGAVF